MARIGAGYTRDCAPDGRDGGLVRGCRGRLRFVHRPRPGRAGEPRASRAPRSSWRSGVALPHSQERGDRAPTPRARYPIPLRWVGARLRRQRPAPMARASCFSTPVSGANSRLEIEPSAGLFRGGALCGAPLLERLLRRLLSELLGFLRALHLHPPWSLSLTALVGVTRSLGRATTPVLEDRRRPRKANAHTEYRTALRRMTCRDHHRDRVRDRRNPREHPHLTCLAALVSLSSTRSANGHPG